MKGFGRLKRWPAICLSALLLVFVALWIDSYFHVRTFIFLPGGDAALGFYSEKGLLFWVEYTPWAHSKELYYMAQWHVPYWSLVGVIAIPLGWYALRKRDPKPGLMIPIPRDGDQSKFKKLRPHLWTAVACRRVPRENRRHFHLNV